MKNKLKLAVCAVLIAVIALAGYDQFFAGNKDPKISYVHADYVIDMDDPTQVIGLGDYVFVAKVNELLRTEYRSDTPYSVYSITVIDNLKGKLKKNTPIEFEKFGGITEDRKNIILRQEDSLLDEDAYYLIIASSEEDGRLAQGGPTAAIKLEGNSKSEINSSDEYKAYKKYCKEEKKFDRERFKCKYEE